MTVSAVLISAIILIGVGAILLWRDSKDTIFVKKHIVEFSGTARKVFTLAPLRYTCSAHPSIELQIADIREHLQRMHPKDRLIIEEKTINTN
jgi:hypothetical protein